MALRSKEEIQKVLEKIDTDGTRYSGMTYEQGIEAALLWVTGQIPNEEFEF